jgi:hypothetical protein
VYEFSGKYDVYVIIIANLIYKTIIGKCVLLHRHAYKVDTTVFFFFPGGLGRGAEGERIIYFLESRLLRLLYFEQA